MDVQAAHDALVPDEHVRLLHRVEIPHADLAVLAAAVDGVVRHGEAVDLRARVEGEDELHQLEVPHLDRDVLGGGGEDVRVVTLTLALILALALALTLALPLGW